MKGGIHLMMRKELGVPDPPSSVLLSWDGEDGKISSVEELAMGVGI